MGVFDSLLSKLGIGPLTCGEINTQIARESGSVASKPPVYQMQQSPPDFEITAEYKIVSKLIEEDYPVILVTGRAGTGKSTLIHWLRRTVNKRLAIVAPTGIAALNVGGQTIHSFFRFPPRDVLDPGDIKKLNDRNLFNKLDLLVVDEISMVRCDIMDAINGFLTLNRSNSSSVPFGGVQLLLVGDLFQLPPVVNRDSEMVLKARGYQNKYFSSAFSLKDCRIAPVELSRVFRQDNLAFIELLNKVRTAEDLDFTIARINETCCRPFDGCTDMRLTCKNKEADIINAVELDKLPTQEYEFPGEIVGKFDQKKSLPVPFMLKLKKGARVMFARNDENSRWVNGTIGEIRNLNDREIRVQPVNGSEPYDVQPCTWENYKYVYRRSEDRILTEKVGEYKQYPLIPAWAVSIHKSQGKTFDSCLIDFGDGAFDYGQAYVALSRCRSMDGISLTRPLRKTDIKCDPFIRKFHEKVFSARRLPSNPE